jgi:dienelactone hydrolase
MTAKTVRITGHNGDEIEVYLARPAGEGPRGGVVVIHHMPGYDRGTRLPARPPTTRPPRRAPRAAFRMSG